MIFLEAVINFLIDIPESAPVYLANNILQNTHKVFSKHVCWKKLIGEIFGFASITSSCDLPFQLKNCYTLSLRKLLVQNIYQL